MENSVDNNIHMFRPQIRAKAPSKQDLSNEYIPKEAINAAQGFESEFAKIMLNEMQNSIPKSSSSSAQEIYTQLLTDERAKAMAQTNQLGIQNVILDQIYPKPLRTKGNFDLHAMQAHPIKAQRGKVLLQGPPQEDTIAINKSTTNPMIKEYGHE